MANSKSLTLKRRADFLNLSKCGKKIRVAPWLIVAYSKTDNVDVRVGWTIPRQVGTAVFRNRIKRYIRENVRKRDFTNCLFGVDVNLIFRTHANSALKTVDHKKLDGVLDNVFAQVTKDMCQHA